MTDTNTIPMPDQSGSSGSQLPADNSQVFVEARPFNGLHIASAIEGLAATNTKAFGGDVASVVIAAATRQIAQASNAVLTERIRSEGKNKHLRNLSITVGTALIGVGITLIRTGNDTYSIGAIVFGALLLLLGWFSGSKEQKI